MSAQLEMKWSDARDKASSYVNSDSEVNDQKFCKRKGKRGKSVIAPELNEATGIPAPMRHPSGSPAHKKGSVSCISDTNHVTVEVSLLSAGALEFHEHGVSTLVMMSMLMKSLIMQKNDIEKDTPVVTTLDLPNLSMSST
jgi:hypothetical protein